ncbi:MAG: type I pullulanase [Ruminococcus sp.]|nr:type I pullulanase [Ruminococcus sp.]
MKLSKLASLLLSGTMLFSATSTAVNAALTEENEVSAGNYYNASYLETFANYAYNIDDFGANYKPDRTEFKVWAPNAGRVVLKLYATGDDSEAGAQICGIYNMTELDQSGIWTITVIGDLNGIYYTYTIAKDGKDIETQDVYSKATGVNGKRSMVVDLDSTDPEGWDTDKHVLFDSAQEAVVWEVHVRDFSIAENSGVSEENKGKYLAFTEGGTKLNSDTSADAVSTGIDYLVKSGINCVQLMPVYDFGSVDERIKGNPSNRNWGYDPVNYNVPEGSYSSDPYNGSTRITEFKKMIQALHDRGISVVMDVVYNHTYSTEDSCFHKTVPGYYFRQTSASVYSNGSGCGNETASDKLMFRRYMIDSVLYWAEEYHIDGFRFDLMGIHDIATMNEIRRALDNLYPDGSGKKILMYGEPWTGGTVAISNGCSQANAYSLDSRVGMFCDSYRDAIKGGTNDDSKGFVQGNTSKTYTVVQGVQGKGFSAKAPSQTIAYADAHDNLILWDKIVKSNSSTSWDSTSAEFKGQMKEALGLVMTSQGIPFITAGTEFCRTKFGDHNSYNSPDSINEIDWSRVATYSEVANYFKGLMQIRQNYSPLKGANFATPTFQSDYGYVVAYTYSNNTAGEWGKMCVLVNSGTQAYTIALNGSGWTVVADSTRAGLKSLGTVSGSSYSVPARSTAILVESSTFNNLQNAEPKYGTLTVKHVDRDGKLLKTSTATYRAGSTYRAMPDSTILFDYELIGTTGTTTGKVESGMNYTVTYTYCSTGVPSGYLTVNYLDEKGKKIKDSVSNRMRQGDGYAVNPVTIQGYQLDTDSYPANSHSTFSGNDTEINFRYKALEGMSTTVHYYKTNSWSDIRCYAYTDSGDTPNGEWATAKLMTNEGNGWYVCTIPAKACYVMFHPTTGTEQEPGQGASGYYASGEVWIQNQEITFNSTVITSHIDIATGDKIAEDVVAEANKVTAKDTYTTSAVTNEDVIIPANASGNYMAGVIDVVYLYKDFKPIVTDPTTAPTTEPTEPITKPTMSVLMGDTDIDGNITISDATMIQMHLAKYTELTDYAFYAADVNGDLTIDISDVTAVQYYLVKLYESAGNTGNSVVVEIEPTVEPTQPSSAEYSTTEPTTEEPTVQPTSSQPVTEPETEPTTQPVTKPTNPPAGAYTVTFTNSLNWGGTIYCYYWIKGQDGPVSWPGTPMQFVETNDYGQKIYSATIPYSYTNVIFTNGSAQTVDISTNGTDTRYYAKTTTNNFGSYEVATW